jgi:DNA-binding CsgD family transcriptional regulator
MLVFAEAKIEQLIGRCCFSKAAAVAESLVDYGSEEDDNARRWLAGVHALAGNDHQLARLIDAELFACRSAAAVAAAHSEAAGATGFSNDLVGGVALAWSGDANGAYELLRRAFQRALHERRFPFAVAACERLAHHALLFGDTEVARNALNEAVGLASDHDLPDMAAHCLAAAARLALDSGDVAGATERLDRALAHCRTSAVLALCAPVGAQIAADRNDHEALGDWISAEVVHVALRGDEIKPAIAATLGLLIEAATDDRFAASVALRRALLAADNPAAAPELFSTAARYGDLPKARSAMRGLAAAATAARWPYIRAHYLLARAYVACRLGRHAQGVNHASDAARAFNAMGLRRWTNEAMLLVVSQEGDGARRDSRNRTSAPVALTPREQQIAHLIRRGARNREIAMTLKIGEHTVERHVSTILARLGLRSRWQIADAQCTRED